MADSTLELALKIRAAVDGVDAVRSLGNSFVTTNAQIETLIRGLTAISGSSEGASKEFDYLAEQARRYGISILDLSDNYVKFIAASKGTVLEGEAARKIFEATASTMAVLGGETVTTHRAFTALSQMMSKGQIYAEELKGQLAEAIPGALQIMAKGLGITTAEMLNLMKAGQLTSSALLPFAIQLEKQYGSLASSTTTFAQATNRLQTEWALLMKRMGDTGAWSVVTGAIDLLGKNSEVLAGVVGGALAVSFVKLTQGIASVVTGITTYITATRLGATATQNAAVSALANAEANAQLALSARTSTTNILATATANEIAARGTALHAVAVRELQLATAQASIANKEYAAATALVGVAQKQVAASTGLFARALSFLTGPAGIITAVIAGFAYMSFAFKEQDEVNKTLEKSTEDYTKSLESMTSAQVIQSNITSSKLINDKKALIDQYKDEISILNNVEDQNSRVGLVYSENGNFLLSFMKVKDKSIELESELGKLTSDLSILEAKRALGLNALNNKYGELVSSEMSLKDSHNELLITQKEQQTEVDRLSGIWFKSREEVIALGIAQDKLRVTNKQVADSNQSIINSSALTRNALSALAESTNLSEEAIRAAFDGNMDYISSLDAQSQAIVVSIRRGIELAKMQSANEAQLKQLNTEYKRIEGSVKAKTEATLKEAESLGDLETKRIAEIQGKRILVDLAELGIKTVNKEIDVINNQIALMKESAIQNEKERSDIEKNIAKEEIKREELLKTKAAREANLVALKAEAIATEVANSLISASFSKNQAIISASSNKIRELQTEYKNLGVTSEAVFNKKQTDILEQIRIEQEKVTEAARTMGVAMRGIFTTLGLDYDEAITGMDFQTKRMIDAFGLLGTGGVATANQIQEAFTNVLGKADTEVELKAIETQLINLGSQGKISGDQLAQSLAAVNTKASELRAAVDPLQIAMEKLGIGVPEKLAAVANESERFYLTIKNSKAPIDEVQQAFLKYAEDALVAAENGAKIDTAQLKVQASALGLGNAFDEIKKKVSETSAEYNGVLSKYESLIALQQKEIEIAKLLVDVGGERNQSSILLNENLGKELVLVADLIKEDQLKIESTKEELVGKEKSLALDKEKLIELQGLRDKGEQLSVTQQEQLTLLERQIPIDEQSIVISKEKVKQAESLVLSYQNISADIARIVAVSEQELNQSNDLIASKKDKIEAEKKLALVMGDTAKAQQLGIESSKIDIEIAKNTAQAKRESAITAQEYVAQLTQQALSDGVVTEEEQKAIDVANRLADAKRNEADAARDTAAALEKNAEAANKLADAERSSKEAADQRAAAGKAVNSIWSAANEVLKATGGNIEKLNAAFLTLQESYASNALSADRWIQFAAGTALAADEVAEAYRGQKAAISAAVTTLERYAETGELTGEVQRTMALNSRDLDSQFNLLDEQDFDRLRAAMDSANDKLREMQELTQSAKDRLAELNAELLEAQGQDQKAQMLREQLDYQQQLAEIEAQRAEAEALGNRELLAILNDQQATLEKIHATKMANLATESDAEGEVIDKTTRRYRELGSAIEGAHQGAKALASADLGNLLGQTDKLYQTLDATRKLL